MTESAAHPDVDIFKKMCRLLELKRRHFFENDWKNCAHLLSRSQFNHLMLVRFSMPCNLGRIMTVTGLTSAGASLFVDKLVQHGFVARVDNPGDRRNVLLSVTPRGQDFLRGIDDRLNAYIAGYFDTCNAAELRSIAAVMQIVCKKLEQ